MSKIRQHLWKDHNPKESSCRRCLMRRRFEGHPDGKRPGAYVYEYFVAGVSIGYARPGSCPGWKVPRFPSPVRSPPSAPPVTPSLDPLTDEELSDLAEKARRVDSVDAEDGVLGSFEDGEAFQFAATPGVVLRMIAEIRHHRAVLPEIARQDR